MRESDALLRLWLFLGIVSCHLVTTHGGCQFPGSWAGQWFQLGLDKTIISVNLTHIETKGDCTSSDGDNKFVVHDRKEKCYRCIAMYEKHTNVLQYKETFCEDERSLELLCNKISGDAVLFSMFRVNAAPVPCPFKSPPFSVVYNKGHGECGSREGEPPSRAESCTDEARLVFKFQACPDIPGTEAAVEELECLGTWRESSNHYLVGRLHHKMATTDEERYRCFMYRKTDGHGYEVAQSGEATCSGMVSPSDGSRTIKLTRVDTGHTHCKFPQWVTQHYHWRSLDYAHSYHFSHRNATLKVTSRTGDVETKLGCHQILSQKHGVARIIVHVVSGCDGGYKCMTLHRRDSHVIQMHQSALYSDPTEAQSCDSDELSSSINIITMITSGLPVNKCPMDGRYTAVLPSRGILDDSGAGPLASGSAQAMVPNPVGEECAGQQTALQSIAVGCNPGSDAMEFQSNCRTVPPTSYSCHGSWKENGTTYVVGSPVSRHSTDARHYCFTFSLLSTPRPTYALQRIAETCATSSTSMAEWTFNITEIGKCSETSGASFAFSVSPILFTLPLFLLR